VVVICPKCKIRLKVGDERIAPEGTRFKCPKCSTVLLVKKPLAKMRPLDKGKVLVAHENAETAERLRSILTSEGYRVVSAKDGIEAMVSATKELPFLAVLSVAIPKIYGFEVCRRLKTMKETKDMKVILMASVYDKRKYRRTPESLHDADDYIEEHDIEDLLPGKIAALTKTAEERAAEPSGAAEKSTSRFEGGGVWPGGGTTAEAQAPKPIVPERARTVSNEPVERARRLARTIVADIYLYSKEKVDDSIRNDTFHKTFSAELREGLKLYENRVSPEVRSRGDFFNEAINDFIKKRKEEILRNS
jgi:predicted Zn finger-like uncharacterized protein